MAFSRGPKIVTDGLVVNLDVGNLKSFKGIPTTNLLNSTGYSYENQTIVIANPIPGTSQGFLEIYGSLSFL